MSRPFIRDTPAGGVTPPSTPPATLPKRRPKPASPQLSALAVAVGQSQRRSSSPVPSAQPSERPAAGPGTPTTAAAHAHLHTPPTAPQAMDLATLLRSGVPQPDALAYILGPSLDPHLAPTILARWLRDPAVRDALATLNGGAWPTLAPEARLDVALDKHYAEMAYFLYTHDFDQATGPELRKLDTARTALEAQRTGRLQANSPFMKFLTALLKPGTTTLRLGTGEGLPGDHRPAMTLGLADVEPVVDAEVTETSDEE